MQLCNFVVFMARKLFVIFQTFADVNCTHKRHSYRWKNNAQPRTV